MDVVKREFAANPPREPLASLAAVVRDYQWRFPRERRDMVWEYCRTAPVLSLAIERACRSRGEDGKMHNHQTRVPEAVREEFARNLIGATMKMHRIKRFVKGDKFDALHDLCESLRPGTGIGPFTLYDVATRIGAFLNIHPTSLYLHAGVRQGWYALIEAWARADGVNPPNKREWASVKRVKENHLPAPLRVLPADEVEDFLCTYRDVFAKLEDFS